MAGSDWFSGDHSDCWVVTAWGGEQERKQETSQEAVVLAQEVMWA